MSTSIGKNGKDTTHIGEYAAKQPLSGTKIVTKMGVKGFNGTAFTRIEESKKAG